jgi:hypothetical protein
MSNTTAERQQTHSNTICRQRQTNHPALAGCTAPQLAGQQHRPVTSLPCPANRHTASIPHAKYSASSETAPRSIRPLHRHANQIPEHKINARQSLNNVQTWIRRGAATTYGMFFVLRMAFATSACLPPSMVPAGPPTWEGDIGWCHHA